MLRRTRSSGQRRAVVSLPWAIALGLLIAACVKGAIVQPVAQAVYLVTTAPIGCHAEPSASAAIVATDPRAALLTIDLEARQPDGLWARDAARQCWVRVEPGPIDRFASVEQANAQVAALRAPRPFLADHRVIAYYGNPLSPVLGVLGEQSPEETVARLRAQADAYAPLSPDRTIVPAIHLIYAVAQDSPGRDGSYLLRMDDELVERYIRLTREQGMLLFLDIQVGRSTVAAELPRIYRFLENEQVHVALDPEFAWPADRQPVSSIGYLDAADINEAQRLLQRFAAERALPTKILVVHQFRRDMIRNKPALEQIERVELVIDMDGFGPPSVKLGSWNAVIRDDNVPLAAIKLFYKYDSNLMSPAEVLALTPSPVIIIYQ